MHGMRWPGADDDVHGMLFQVFFQKSDRRSDPEAAGVGDEHVSPYPHGNLLGEGFLLGVDGVHFTALSSPALFPGKGTVDIVWLKYLAFDNFHLRRNLTDKRLVNGYCLRIERGVDYGLPSFRRQIFCEFHPPLNA